jgi:hypothetical protein
LSLACALVLDEDLPLNAPIGAGELVGMKKILLAILLTIAMAGVALAQAAETRGRTSASNTTSASKQGRQVNLQSDTQMAAQLENTLDARHAKAGDRVVMKTTQAIKQDGQVVVPKGSRLMGHVTDVQQRTTSDNQSIIGIAFDRLQNGSMNVPITATIVSITQANARTQSAASDDMLGSQTMTSSSSRSSTSAGSGQRGSGGGLLGGVGNTVGGVVNTTTSTVGNVAGGATTAVGSTVGATTSTTTNATSNLGGALRGLQITQSGNASASGGSTLSLTGGNLRLESGTTFNLLISNSANAGNP